MVFRTRSLGIGLLAACVIVAVGAAAPPAWAQAARTVQVFANASIPQLQVVQFSVRCPPGYRAINGRVVASDGPRLVNSHRLQSSQQRWVFRFVNPGEVPPRVRVMVLCARIQIPGRWFLDIRHRTQTINAVIGAERSTALRAPSGSMPVGLGIRCGTTGQSTARASGVGCERSPRPDTVFFPRQQLISRGVSIVTRAFGPLPEQGQQVPITGQVDYARLIARLARGGSSSSSSPVAGASRKPTLHATVRRITRSFPQGNHTFRASCPKRHLAIDTGHDLGLPFNPNDAFMYGHWPGPGRRAQWEFFVGADSHRIVFHLRCWDLRRLR